MKDVFTLSEPCPCTFYPKAQFVWLVWSLSTAPRHSTLSWPRHNWKRMASAWYGCKCTSSGTEHGHGDINATVPGAFAWNLDKRQQTKSNKVNWTKIWWSPEDNWTSLKNRWRNGYLRVWHAPRKSGSSVELSEDVITLRPGQIRAMWVQASRGVRREDNRASAARVSTHRVCENQQADKHQRSLNYLKIIWEKNIFFDAMWYRRRFLSIHKWQRFLRAN